MKPTRQSIIYQGIIRASYRSIGLLQEYRVYNTMPTIYRACSSARHLCASCVFLLIQKQEHMILTKRDEGRVIGPLA